MAEKELAFHYVCTREEAQQLIEKHDRFWVSNCGCRENKGICERSRVDVCLQFREDIPGSGGSNLKETSRSQVDSIIREAEVTHLVTRPFRNEENMAETDGICFCCDDCCEYFVKPGEKCDKGDLVERTDSDRCMDCGTCVEVCYFKARSMDDGKLTVEADSCYGCGLCTDVCPQECIQMVSRE
jgi:Pyruvate/2-oxoacid:ferredoxin oxidoreductase delta subunit